MAAAAILTRSLPTSRYTSNLLASLYFAVTYQSAAAFTVVASISTQQHRHCVSVSMVKGKGKRKSNSSSDGAGVMMILSPAKTLDLSPFEAPSDSFPQATLPDCDPAKTKAVSSEMKSRSKKELEKLLGISANLAEKSHQYWADFDGSGTAEENRKPAIYAFSGAAYQGLEIGTCSEAAIKYMQSNLRIVDPLYGTLRPLDLIQPYRLEMATKKALDYEKMNGAKDLARWWRPAVTASLGKDLESRNDKILLNIASDEYSAAVDESALPDGTCYVKVVFQQEGKVIAVHAKKARGMMVRYLAENGIEDVDGIRKFSVEGYNFIKSKSTDDTIVFNRPKPPATKKEPKIKQKPKEEKIEPKGKRARTSRR